MRTFICPKCEYDTPEQITLSADGKTLTIECWRCHHEWEELASDNPEYRRGPVAIPPAKFDLTTQVISESSSRKNRP